MAQKADLMLEAAKKNEEIERLEERISQYDRQLKDLPMLFDKQRREAVVSAQRAFDRRQEELRARVDAIITKKRAEVAALVDSFPGMETKEFAGKVELEELEEHLKKVYPADMIEGYVCMNPIELQDDEEAFRLYSKIESMVMSLTRGGKLSSMVFNGITDALTNVSDDPKVGMKVVPAILLLYLGGIFIIPFVFLGVLTTLGVASAVHGMYVRNLLRKMYSVKMYLNATYDEDIFQEDRRKLLRKTDDFLEDARLQGYSALDQNKFEHDPEVDRKLEQKFEIERKKMEQARDLDGVTLKRVKEDLSRLLIQIEELEDQEKKRAESARKEHLETVKWEMKWMEYLFIDVTPENRLLMMPFSKANSLYYANDIDELQNFSKLTVFQCMLHMHPSFATQIVLDYKYMGGDLNKFLVLEGKSVQLGITPEEHTVQHDLIDNDVKARTKSILASSDNLDQFNELMASYDATGEYYAIVHVFGLKNVTPNMLNWFKNGPRVGYIFKLYLTTAELKQLKDEIPLDDLKDFFEIKGNPIPRTGAAVRRLLEAAS